MLPLAWLALLVLCAAGAAVQPWLLLLPAGLCALLLAAGLWCAVALRSPSGLCAGPALAVIHNAWAIGFLVGFGSRSRAGHSPRHRAANSATVATPGE